MTRTDGINNSGPDFDMTGEVTDDMLMALADGEISGAQAQALHARIAGNATLRTRYALFVDSAEALRRIEDAGPVPQALIDTIMTTPIGPSAADTAATGQARATVVPLRRRGAAAAAGFGVGQMALAASLVLAVGVAGYLTGRSGAGPSVAADPAGAAAVALAAVPTGGETALADGGTGRVLASFDTDLGLCRMLDLQFAAGGRERAVVCETGEDWVVALSVNAGTAGDFIPASDLAVGMIDGFLDQVAAGAPLSPEEEAARLAR